MVAAWYSRRWVNSNRNSENRCIAKNKITVKLVFCHLMPERSFFYKGRQFPVCARCTGVFIGQILSLCVFWFYVPSILALLFCCLICFVDWLLQYCKVVESTNKRRLLTGISGGYGLLTIQLIIIRYICEYVIELLI